MSPEDKTKFEELEKTVEDLKSFVNTFLNTASIPNELEQSLRARLGIEDLQANTSAKTAASETQAVDEGGTSTYNVATPMTGFIQITDTTGTVREVPYY